MGWEADSTLAVDGFTLLRRMLVLPRKPEKLQPDCLLAKSVEGRWKGSYSLVGHTADVMMTVTALVNELGERLIKQFGLKCDLSHLRETARLAAYIHDWGKVNEHFQGVVRYNMQDAHPKRYAKEHPQLIRHEVVSVLLAWEFRSWLEQANGDFMTAMFAAGGHHVKLGGRAGKENDEVGEIRPCGDIDLSLYTLGHRHFTSLLKYGRKALNLPALKGVMPSTYWTIQEIKHRRNTLRDAFNSWSGDPVFAAVVKALLICGDCIGSAAPSVEVSITQWIHTELNRTLNEDKVERIIQARLPKGETLRAFQTDLANSRKRVTLARAGCGTGKTLGAYAWAKFHANGRKLFFCYPTTGTSTEGFIDYVHGQADAALLHSRADVDLTRWEEDQKKREVTDIYKTGEEEEAGDGSENEIAQKLSSFKAWGREVSVCTVDTVLGLLQCNRRPLYCFPAIANAAFVFDEVHCYDDKLFNALLRFLETMKAPVLLMSASVLPWQKEAIEQAVGEPIAVIQGPKELEALPRYRFQNLDAPDWKRVEEELASGGKVLWVCNQVNTAIEVYREAQRRGLNAVVYHSRFRYEDRVDHHRAVVDGFKGDQPMLAIATQVAEMSLDLSATLLVTQIADPAGLIQRLGRLNRKYCGHALDALFYPDEKVGYPYSKEALGGGKSLVETFTGEVNQADLAKRLEELENHDASQTDSESGHLVLLDGVWRTYSASLREGGFNITAVLEEDLATIKRLPNRELPRYTVPLPGKGTNQWEKHKFYPIAPTKQWSYSSELGAFSIKGGE
jgi:CRISPR-associated endonuclease/helicase Cas3